MMQYKLYQGDNMETLRRLEDNSVDSIVTDPPYGLSFMNKKWDYDVPSVDFWKEAFRVLKPGGHVISFSSARTYHRMAVNLEDAGFEIRDQLVWVYGSGFPKSHNIGKNLEKRKGIIPDKHRYPVEEMTPSGDLWERDGKLYRKLPDINGSMEIGKGDGKQAATPVFEEVIDWDNPWLGWGTALKPAHEPMVLARKPISEKTVVDNVIRWGVGGINVDGCRIGDEVISINQLTTGASPFGQYDGGSNYETKQSEGRFPANFILQDEEQEFSKYFYIPKVSKKERNRGVEHFEAKANDATDFRPWMREAAEAGDKEKFTAHGRAQVYQNNHPTVKPVDLMRYLVRLVTPTDGTVLDPYNGSGATGIACVLEDFNYIGMEFEQDYVDISEARIAHAVDNPEEWEK